MPTNRTFNNVQLTVGFSKDISGASKLSDAILYSNLEPDGSAANSNIAISFAKLYTWAHDLIDFPETGTAIKIKEGVVPDVGSTYTFAEGSTDGSFKYSEDGGAYQEVAIHNVATKASDGIVKEAELPKYRVVKVDNAQVSGTADRFKLQICRNWSAPASDQIWIDVSDINLGLFATSASGDDEIGKIKSALLPSYVDDIVEGYYYNSAWYSDSSHTSRVYGQSDKIYVDLSTDKSYRCSPSGTPGESGYTETWVDISNPISAEEIYSLCGMPSGGNFSTSKHGLVPAASGTGDTGKFLRGDGTWVAIPAAITYSLSTGTTYGTDNESQTVTLTPSSGSAQTAIIAKMTGATGSAAGKAGLVPKPKATDNTKFLTGAGTWATPENTTYSLEGNYGTNNNTWVTTLKANGTTAAGTSTVPTASTSVYGITKLSTATDSTSTSLAATPSAVNAVREIAAGKSTVSVSNLKTSGTKIATITIDGTGNDVYVQNMSAATASAAGTRGTVQPPINSMDKYLRGDNTWVDPIADIGILTLHCTNGTS